MGGYYDALIKFWIPFEFVQRSKLHIADVINLTMNRVVTLLAYRGIIIKDIHRENRFGTEATDELRGLQVKEITLTAL